FALYPVNVVATCQLAAWAIPVAAHAKWDAWRFDGQDFCCRINRSAQNRSRTRSKVITLLHCAARLPCGNAAGFPVPGLHV
ncbi:MAG: hypothetical protein E6848_40875, partial [Bradyrhizobium sp.]|nr:hypothetical protein [Bradyrhizobium sp.]